VHDTGTPGTPFFNLVSRTPLPHSLASMYPRSSGYQNLHDVYHEPDLVAVSKRQLAYDLEYPDNGTADTEPQWYWRLAAQVSIWMILGGYVQVQQSFHEQTADLTELLLATSFSPRPLTLIPNSASPKAFSPS
jgi:hypothetical protein